MNKNKIKNPSRQVRFILVLEDFESGNGLGAVPPALGFLDGKEREEEVWTQLISRYGNEAIHLMHLI